LKPCKKLFSGFFILSVLMSHGSNAEKFIISRIVSNQLVNNKEGTMILFLFFLINQHKQVGIQEVFMCCSGELCSFPTLELNPYHPCSSCNEIVHTLFASEIIGDGHGGYQVCFKCSELKQQAELVAEVRQAQDEDVAMDEQEEEDGIIAALAPPVLMPNICKPVGLEAATSAVGSSDVHPYASTPHHHGGVFRITTPCPSSDTTPTSTPTGGMSARRRATKSTEEVLPTTNSCNTTQKTAQKINKGVRTNITRDGLYHI
jgi:hypothetical protein